MPERPTTSSYDSLRVCVTWLFQDLSLVVLREIFGCELADATAKHAEYRWVPTDDGGADPFTHTIPTRG